MLRLDRYLTDMGAGSRSEVKKMIKSSQVSVNGVLIKSPEHKVDERADCVMLDSVPILYQDFEYYMLNKPDGVVSATEDKRQRTVLDLFEGFHRIDLFPVGRLDKDTEGLLLITNDGQLAHRLLSPKKHVDKTYYARIRGRVTQETVLQFKEGIDIGTDRQEMTLPAELKILSIDSVDGNVDFISQVQITIQEGKYHQIKRMFGRCGLDVIYLKRESMGPLRLDESLKPGEYRVLSDDELRRLKGL